MDSTTSTQVIQPTHRAQTDSFMEIFVSSWLPFLILIAVYVFFMRGIKKGGKFVNPMVAQLDEMNITLKEISQKLDKR